MKVNEFYTPQPAVKFEKRGDFVDGTICDEPSLEPDKYGTAGDRVLVLALLEGDVTKRLYSRRQMSGAIAQAVSDAGADELECGGRLLVEYVDDKPTGAGSSPMKIYQATYWPPEPVGAGTFCAETA